MNKKKKNRATNRNESWMPWKLELLSVNRIKGNKKDIYVIYFWPDTEALCINLWNVLKKIREKKLVTILHCFTEILKKLE